MRRPDFEHVIAAAALISEEDEIVVIGSQSIWGSVEDPPEEMVRSLEAEIYPRRDPSRAEEIDGQLGDGSQFQRTYGYYAHGVGPETSKGPAGWERHDLVLSKCAAGRERDWEFAKAALSAGIVEQGSLLALIDRMPIEASASGPFAGDVERNPEAVG